MLLTLKIVLVPCIIALISFAGRVWGPRVSGLLGGLPVVAGPIVVFVALEQGMSFGAAAAAAALAGVSSIGLFCFCYAVATMYIQPHEASRFSCVAKCVLVGWSGFGLSTIFLSRLPLSLVSAFVLSIAVLTLITRFFPKFTAPLSKPEISAIEIFVRMVAAVVILLTITFFADVMGPKYSGLIAPFPVAGTVLAGFTHYNSGTHATRQLLLGFVCGNVGMAVFFLTLALSMGSHGLVLGVPLSIVLSVVSVYLVSRFRSYLQGAADTQFKPLSNEDIPTTLLSSDS